MSGRYRFHAEFDDLEQVNSIKQGLNRPRHVAGRWGEDDEDNGYGSYDGYSSDRAYGNWDEDEDEFRDEEDDFLEVDERPSWLREAEDRRRAWVDEEDEQVVIVRESKVTTTVSHPEPGVTEISTTEVTIETPLHVVSAIAADPVIEIEARPVAPPAKKAAPKKAAAKKPPAKAAKKVSVKVAKKVAKKAAPKRPAKKAATKKSAKKAVKQVVAKKAAKKPVKQVVVKTPVKKAAAKKAVKKAVKKAAKKR